jgi:hypothetical protein
VGGWFGGVEGREEEGGMEKIAVMGWWMMREFAVVRRRDAFNVFGVYACGGGG